MDKYATVMKVPEGPPLIEKKGRMAIHHSLQLLKPCRKEEGVRRACVRISGVTSVEKVARVIRLIKVLRKALREKYSRASLSLFLPGRLMISINLINLKNSY